VDEWNAWRLQCQADVKDSKPRKTRVDKKHEDKEEIEIWVEEVIEQTEEVVED
jgi:translation initiation factor 3 subunit B